MNGVKFMDNWLIYDDAHGYETWVSMGRIQVMQPWDDYLDIFLDVGERSDQAAHNETVAWHRIYTDDPSKMVRDITTYLAEYRRSF